MICPACGGKAVYDPEDEESNLRICIGPGSCTWFCDNEAYVCGIESCPICGGKEE